VSEPKRLTPAEAREAVRRLLAREHSWADAGAPDGIARRALEYLDHLRYTLRVWEEAMPLRDLHQQAVRDEYADKVLAQLERDQARADWHEANPCPVAEGAEAIHQWHTRQDAMLSETLRQYDAAVTGLAARCAAECVRARAEEVAAKCRILLEMLPPEEPRP
jgi:hypothetical protein